MALKVVAGFAAGFVAGWVARSFGSSSRDVAVGLVSASMWAREALAHLAARASEWAEDVLEEGAARHEESREAERHAPPPDSPGGEPKVP